MRAIKARLAVRSERWNPASRDAWDAHARASQALSLAFWAAGRGARAAAVAACGTPEPIHGPDGDQLVNKSGKPAAVTHRCGSRLCARCARDVAGRQRRRIMERLKELEARSELQGPIWRRPPPAADEVDSRDVLLKIAAEEREKAAELAALAWDRERGASYVDALERCGVENDDEDDAFDAARTRSTPFVMPKAAPKLRRPRAQRRPPRRPSLSIVAGGANNLDDRHVAAVHDGREYRRIASSFRIGLPPTADGYGCRFLTLTQPARPMEELNETLDRLEDALARFLRSQVFKAFVDGAVVRIEYELSTPEKRKALAATRSAEGNHAEAADLRSSTATWWHGHVHLLLWGRRWPHSTACLSRGASGPPPRDCSCTRCAGIDDESALLVNWRRALVETKRYEQDLKDVQVEHVPRRLSRDVVVEETLEGQTGILRALRIFSHASRRTWARALEGVKIGGAHIKTPNRISPTGERFSPEAAVAEAVKYSTKPISIGSMSQDRVVEMIRATDGRRLVRCTGLLFGLHLHEDEREAGVTGIEGTEQEPGIGRYALDSQGRVVDADDFDFRHDPESIERYRAVLEAWHAKRETGPRDRRRDE